MKCPCGSHLSGKQEKYCCQNCSRYYSTKARRQKKIADRVLKCLNCGVERKGLKFWRKYCCEYCRNSYKGKKYHNDNLEVERRRKLSDYYQQYFGGNKELIWKKYNNQCDFCGESDVERLTIHHKDLSGRTLNPNNSPENLILLCNSCHSKVHHYLRGNRVDDDIVRSCRKL